MRISNKSSQVFSVSEMTIRLMNMNDSHNMTDGVNYATNEFSEVCSCF